MEDHESAKHTSEKLYALLTEKLVGWTVTMGDDCKIAVESLLISIECPTNDHHKIVLVSWTNQDEDLGAYVLGLLQNMG